MRVVEFPSENIISKSEINEGLVDNFNLRASKMDLAAQMHMAKACDYSCNRLRYNIPAARVILFETINRGIGVQNLKVGYKIYLNQICG